MHPYVYSNTTHNSQDMKTTVMSIDRWTDKKEWHINTMEWNVICRNMNVLGEAHWLKPPTLAKHHSNQLHEFIAGDPDKEYGTNKPPPTGRVRERSKGDTMCPSTSQNPSR